MNKPVDHSLLNIDPDDIGFNDSSNPSFEAVLNARLSRRSILKGGIGGAAAALFGGLSVSACGGGGGGNGGALVPDGAEKLLSFTPVAKSIADMMSVPPGYTATVIYALGDPLTNTTAAFKNDGTDTGYDTRSGDCHDGMEYFGLSANGQPAPNSNDRALLGINHEYINATFLHVSGPSPLPRPASEVDIEVDCHGVAIVEIQKTGGKFAYVKSSNFNRRITPLTEIELSGPVRGNALVKTKFSTDGSKTRGTLNNCGTGRTPWGTLLTGEENWSGYFTRAAGDDTARNDKSVVALKRYGRNAGAASRYGWETAGSADKYARWNISKSGLSTDGTDDYRNEANTMGYVTEIDPYDKTVSIKKRTALGRNAHESAAFSKAVAGKPLAVYLGDDSQGEYIYKWVSTANWDAADATATNRIAVGDKYLDNGKLYVAKFNADGTGAWLELSITNPAISGYPTYAFADAGDVAIHARIAADAVGATKMDRPEWCSVHPVTGEIYFTLTNNSNRALAAAAGKTVVDAANPRSYSDTKGTSTVQNGNVNGHILRVAETNGDVTAMTFKWDVYLFASESGASPSLVNLSSLTSDNDFSSPDGLCFSRSTGICWIETDDGAYTDVTNCMLLAGLPGQVGDGTKVTLNYGTSTIDTYVGKKPTADTLKRFLVGPYDQEITGLCESPDGKTLFINVQHPGEGTPISSLAAPASFTSHWPGNTGYGPGGAIARPRSATVMITKDDGGRIGS